MLSGEVLRLLIKHRLEMLRQNNAREVERVGNTVPDPLLTFQSHLGIFLLNQIASNEINRKGDATTSLFLNLLIFLLVSRLIV